MTDHQHWHADGWCASLPHPLFSIAVWACPHQSSIHATVTAGPTEAPTEMALMSFGPFDDADDVRRWLANEVHGQFSALLDELAGCLSSPLVNQTVGRIVDP